MTLNIALIISLAIFVVLMAFWVNKSEKPVAKKNSFLDPKKSYEKAKEFGLNLPEEYNDALPGV